ncbi:hypothetical protein FH972_004769 [Carpinus fangiana]|uniref:HMA domain-containing protein n=1 Tax=Carpinus fangiana TaxID=176857 RepID=A0A5N6QQJ1_9ROSI|nr:hypothetical protein FH972_004769 [Carpinus fangiana]
MDSGESRKRLMESIYTLQLADVESIYIDMDKWKLTMIGDFDHTLAVGELRNRCAATLVSISEYKKRRCTLLFCFA